MCYRYTPSPQDEIELYQRIFESFNGDEIVFRLLDIGGDKPLPYLGMPEETNHFLGHRAIPFALDNLTVLRRQIAAIVRAAGERSVKILVPLVSTPAEVAEVRRVANEVKDELLTSGEHSQDSVKPQVGIMIEVPSVVLALESYLEYADFFCIGTNDLTQYILAVDRTNGRVADRYDYANEAVLKALAAIQDVIAPTGKPVTVCGEMASHPESLQRLLELGYRTFSVSPGNYLRVKYEMRQKFATPNK